MIPDVCRRFMKYAYDTYGWVGHMTNILGLFTMLPTIYWWVKPWKVAAFGEAALANPTLLGFAIGAFTPMLVVPPFVQAFRASDERIESTAQTILTFGTSIGAGIFLSLFGIIVTDPKPDLHLVLALTLGYAASALAVAMSFWYISAASRAFQRTIDQFMNMGVRLPFLGLVVRELCTRRLHDLAYSLSKAWLLPSPTVSQERLDTELKAVIEKIMAEFSSEVAEKLRLGLWANYLSYTLREPMPVTPDGREVTKRLDTINDQLQRLEEAMEAA